MRLIWTPLPHRRDENGLLHASIYVGPRLEHSGGPGMSTVLGDSEFDRMRNWPDFVNSLDIAIEIDGQPVAAEREKVDPKWWELLFSDDTPVTTHELPDHSTTIIHTYPVNPVLEHIEQVYKTIAEASPIDHPPLTGGITSLVGLLGDLGQVDMNEDMEGAYRHALLQKDPATGKLKRALAGSDQVAGLSDPTLSYWKLSRFYNRPESQQPPLPTLDASLVPNRPEKPKPDFHTMLGYLADFPQLLRRLGLIIDVVFEDPGATASGALRVLIDPKDPALNVRPRVSYLLQDDRFQVPPRSDALFADNCLRLEFDREIFRIYQVDVDGGALKLLSSAAGLLTSSDLAPQIEADPGTGTVPSLRSGGITVALMDRAADLIDALDGSTDLDPKLEQKGNELMLEDVLRGYRIDIFDAEDGRWRSLQRRLTNFVFPGIPGQSTPDKLENIEDEATIRAQAATASDRDVSDLNDPNKAGSGDLYLHEALFGWDGWSLAAPRPGKIIVEPGEGDPDGGTATSVTTERNDIGTDLPVQATTTPAPRTLPRLRYGREYQVRARAVDLAGNSLPDDPADLNLQVSPVIRYVRHDPLASPALVRTLPDTEGESLELMVIRSDRAPETGIVTPPSGYGQLPHVAAALSGLEHTYGANSQRHVAPPKTSVQGAELHGVLDDAFGPGGDPGGVFKIALKEEGTFFDKLVIDPTTGLATIDVEADIEVSGWQGDKTPFGRGFVPPQGMHLYRTDASLRLPYLPDPAALGIALHGDGLDHLEKFPAGTAWWDRSPFRIRLVDGVKAIASLNQGHLDVSLPPSERVRLRLSSLPDPARIDQFVHFANLPDAKKSALLDDAKAGRMWLLTPYRYIEMVHATQHPLEAPVLVVSPKRGIGETYCGFTGHIENHAKSTGRIDVHAKWSDPLDSGIDDQPPVDGVDGRLEPAVKAAVAYGWDVEAWDDTANVAAQGRISRHEFGDTKHHLVTYRPVATTRFREYFHPDITAVPANIEHPGDEVTLSIPNSARPSPPEVLYVIPTFGWEDKELSSGFERKRLGGGLRIYLDRPWYSSGRGEKLAVVLPQPPERVRIKEVLEGNAFPVEAITGLFSRTLTTDMISDRSFGRAVNRRVAAEITDTFLAFPWTYVQAKDYYTIWGRDPVWRGLSPKSTARMSDFPQRLASSRSGLTIPEAPFTQVAVAAHEVHYDTKRELWYCDVEIDAGSAYFPFVRLGLARYQPESIPGAHLSSVVVADFVQLTADRTASVVVADSTAKVTVSGVGPSNITADHVISGPFTPISRPELSRRVTAVLQEHDPMIPGDLGWSDVGDEVQLGRRTQIRRLRSGITTWSGDIDLHGAAHGAETHRILIREYEGFPRDYMPSIDPPVTRLIPGTPIHPIGWRIVYADALPL